MASPSVMTKKFGKKLESISVEKLSEGLFRELDWGSSEFSEAVQAKTINSADLFGCGNASSVESPCSWLLDGKPKPNARSIVDRWHVKLNSQSQVEQVASEVFKRGRGIRVELPVCLAGLSRFGRLAFGPEARWKF